MSGGTPLRRPYIRPGAVLILVIGCYAAWNAAITAACAQQTEARLTNMIPQEEVIVQEVGLEGTAPVTYSLRIYKDGERIKLKGVMSSQEDYKTVMGLLKASFPAVDLNDRLKVRESAPDANLKMGGLSFALKLLGYLESGQAVVDNNGLSLEGFASTAVVLNDVRKLIENNKPTGVPLKNIRIAPPAKSWSASVLPDGTLKFAGVVPSRASKKSIAEETKRIFPSYSIDDNTVVNKHVPKRWSRIAIKSLRMLTVLNQGTVELTDDAIHLRGIAPNELALKTINAMAADFPSGFAVKSEVTAPASSVKDSLVPVIAGPAVHPDLAEIPAPIGAAIMQR